MLFIQRYCIDGLWDEKVNDQIALICFDEQMQFFSTWREMFFGVCGIISSLFLLLTLLIYIVLPEMRDVQDKAMMSMMTSFMIAFFLNGIQQLNFTIFEGTFCLIAGKLIR
jgi:hypothetical protein